MQVLTLHGLGEIETDIENRHGELLLVVDPLKSQGAHFRGKLGVGREVKHARAFSVRDVTLAIESARIAIDGELHFLLAGLREVEAGKRGHWPRGLVTRGVPVLMMNQREFHLPGSEECAIVQLPVMVSAARETKPPSKAQTTRT